MKHKDQYKVLTPRGTVEIIGGGEEIEAIKRKIADGQHFEILEKVNVEEGEAAPQLPKAGEGFKCPICGTKGVGRNRFKKQEDVDKHVQKKHAG